MSEIQSVEGKPIKKGLSPGRMSAVGALVLLAIGLGALLVGQLLRPAPIPVDRVLAVIGPNGELTFANEDGSSPAAFPGTGIPNDASWVRWAPGGDFVALGSLTELTIADREGVVAWRHALSAQASIVWSPDGSRIAIYQGIGADLGPVAQDATIEVLTSTGELEWKVPLPDGFGFLVRDQKLTWAPDGRSIAFTGLSELIESGRQPTALWIADVAAQALREVPGDGGSFDYGPAWASNGTLYVGSRGLIGPGVWAIDPATGTRMLVLEEPQVTCPADPSCLPPGVDPIVPSPDGGSLALAHDGRFGLSILVLGTSETIRVQAPNSDAGSPYVWTGDGAALLYQGHTAAIPSSAVLDDLLRFDIATRETTRIASGVRWFDLLARLP